MRVLRELTEAAIAAHAPSRSEMERVIRELALPETLEEIEYFEEMSEDFVEAFGMVVERVEDDPSFYDRKVRDNVFTIEVALGAYDVYDSIKALDAAGSEYGSSGRRRRMTHKKRKGKYYVTNIPMWSLYGK